MLQSRMPGNARCKRYAWVRKKVQRKEKHFFLSRNRKECLIEDSDTLIQTWQDIHLCSIRKLQETLSMNTIHKVA